MVEAAVNPQAEAKKTEGNNAFKTQNYAKALLSYTEAIAIQPTV